MRGLSNEWSLGYLVKYSLSKYLNLTLNGNVYLS